MITCGQYQDYLTEGSRYQMDSPREFESLGQEYTITKFQCSCRVNDNPWALNPYS